MVNIDRNHASRSHYQAKGEIIGQKIMALDTRREYDFLIPLDCDEFVVLKNEVGYTESRDQILLYLGSLVGERRALRFPYQLANHPLHHDVYHYFRFFKSLFTADTFKWMDHGHHLGESRRAEGFKNTRLIQLHFHYKPFDLMIRQARQSWVGTVKVDDREKLKNYVGPSGHLVPYLLMSKEEYYRQFLSQVHFHLPTLRELLGTLGAPLILPSERADESLLIRIAGSDSSVALGGNGITALVPRNKPLGVQFVVTRFNEAQYLDANPDLVSAGIEPTYHFCHHGFKEGRPLRPAGKTLLQAGDGTPSDKATTTSVAVPADPGLNGTLTQQYIAAYIRNEGPVRPGPDGKRCLELATAGKARPGWLTIDPNDVGHVLNLDVTRPFPIAEGEFDFVYSEHMIEHFPFENGRSMVRESFRILKPGGVIRIATSSIGFLLRLFSTDRSKLEDHYIEWAMRQFVSPTLKPMASFVFNNFMRNFGHRFIYDRATLTLILEEAEFTNIKECDIGESEHEHLRGLESIDRLPRGFLALESMIFEGTRTPNS